MLLSRRSLAKEYEDWELRTHRTSRITLVATSLSESQKRKAGYLQEYSRLRFENQKCVKRGIKAGIKLLAFERWVEKSGLSAILAFSFNRFFQLKYEDWIGLKKRLQETKWVWDLAETSSPWLNKCQTYYDKTLPWTSTGSITQNNVQYSSASEPKKKRPRTGQNDIPSILLPQSKDTRTSTVSQEPLMLLEKQPHGTAQTDTTVHQTANSHEHTESSQTETHESVTARAGADRGNPLRTESLRISQPLHEALHSVSAESRSHMLEHSERSSASRVPVNHHISNSTPVPSDDNDKNPLGHGDILIASQGGMTPSGTAHQSIRNLSTGRGHNSLARAPTNTQNGSTNAHSDDGFEGEACSLRLEARFMAEAVEVLNGAPSFYPFLDDSSEVLMDEAPSFYPFLDDSSEVLMDGAPSFYPFLDDSSEVLMDGAFNFYPSHNESSEPMTFINETDFAIQ